MVDFLAKLDTGENVIKQCKILHVALGLDPIEGHIYLMCIGEEQKCIDSRINKYFKGVHIDLTYFHVFTLNDDFADNLFEWFKACGIPTSEACLLIRKIGNQLKKLLFKG